MGRNDQDVWRDVMAEDETFEFMADRDRPLLLTNPVGKENLPPAVARALFYKLSGTL